MFFGVVRTKNGRQQVRSPSATLRVGMTSQKSKSRNKSKDKSRFPTGMTSQKGKGKGKGLFARWNAQELTSEQSRIY
jgi:hypothetical protein